MSSTVMVALRVKATPARTFRVFTEQVGLWWRPNGLFAFTDGEPGVPSFEGGEGGRFVETLSDGQVFEIGRIRVWEPGARLVFGWRTARFGPEHHTEVEVRFDAVGEETRVTVTHRGWETVPTAHAARHGWPDGVFLTREGEWWRTMLQALAGPTALDG